MSNYSKEILLKFISSKYNLGKIDTLDSHSVISKSVYTNYRGSFGDFYNEARQAADSYRMDEEKYLDEHGEFPTEDFYNNMPHVKTARVFEKYEEPVGKMIHDNKAVTTSETYKTENGDTIKSLVIDDGHNTKIIAHADSPIFQSEGIQTDLIEFNLSDDFIQNPENMQHPLFTQFLLETEHGHDANGFIPVSDVDGHVYAYSEVTYDDLGFDNSSLVKNLGDMVDHAE